MTGLLKYINPMKFFVVHCVCLQNLLLSIFGNLHFVMLSVSKTPNFVSFAKHKKIVHQS